MELQEVSTKPDVSEFLERFAVAVDFQTRVPIVEDTELANLPEWDSLAALGVIIMCDTDYGVTITGDDLKDSVRVVDIYAKVQAKRAA